MGSSRQGLHGSELKKGARAAGAELVGTAILVYAGTAVATAAILERPIAGPAYDSLAIALAFGLALAALVGALGHVSGAHLNPAVTIALAATKRFPSQFVPAYIGAQLIGAAFGALATWLTYGGPARAQAKLAATYPVDGVTDLRALAVEALVTFVLVFVVMAVAVDDRVPSAAIASIAAGFALALGVFIAGPVTGGAVNPARALGPMIVAGDLSSFWVYVVGPIVGGVAAALLYDRVAAKAEAPDAAGESDDQETGNGHRERTAAAAART
ncbi:MAG TPA: MIP family channel protein [Solirubrobacteraceae bacterium]|jgi:aquaporin Z/aquaporin NIP